MVPKPIGALVAEWEHFRLSLVVDQKQISFQNWATCSCSFLYYMAVLLLVDIPVAVFKLSSRPAVLA